MPRAPGHRQPLSIPEPSMLTIAFLFLFPSLAFLLLSLIHGRGA